MNSPEHEITKDELVLTWHGNSDNHSDFIFEWRGKLIQVKYGVNALYKSTTETVTIVFRNKSYSFGIGRSSAGGGRFGNQPRIETSTHFLTFIQGIKSLTIIDNLRKGAVPKRDKDIAFKVIKAPEG